MASRDTQSFPFFQLPGELRTLIYEELLVTDASFRLGHHGPFCLVPRKRTHPAILRACKRTHDEGSPVLYGSNSFFLGTVGFKPIYSFSFLASIGPTNAARIRKLVVHSNYPSLLTRTYLKRWIDSLGVEFDRLKVLAVSFETDPVDLGTALPANALPHVLQLLPPVLQSNNVNAASVAAQAQAQAQAQTQAQVNGLATVAGPGAGAGGPTSPQSMTATVTVTTTTTWQTVAPPAGTGAPPTQVWSQASPASTSITAVIPGLHANPNVTAIASASATATALQTPPPLPAPSAFTPATITGFQHVNGIGHGHGTTASVTLRLAKQEDADYEWCAAREKGWMRKARTREVREVVNTGNTDLRAGQAWLIYRDPGVRRLPEWTGGSRR